MTCLEEEYERIGPAPADDPLARLDHTLRVYEDTPDDERVVTATFNVYGNKVWTGITWGDLRALVTITDEMVERAAEALATSPARKHANPRAERTRVAQAVSSTSPSPTRPNATSGSTAATRTRQ